MMINMQAKCLIIMCTLFIISQMGKTAKTPEEAASTDASTSTTADSPKTLEEIEETANPIEEATASTAEQGDMIQPSLTSKEHTEEMGKSAEIPEEAPSTTASSSTPAVQIEETANPIEEEAYSTTEQTGKTAETPEEAPSTTASFPTPAVQGDLIQPSLTSKEHTEEMGKSAEIPEEAPSTTASSSTPAVQDDLIQPPLTAKEHREKEISALWASADKENKGFITVQHLYENVIPKHYHEIMRTLLTKNPDMHSDDPEKISKDRFSCLLTDLITSLLEE